MGIETEYGISAPGVPDLDPVTASSILIGSYAGTLRRIRWDYDQESPLRDVRASKPVGAREGGDEDVGLPNVLLPNGARYYVDHAHPEYSTPECATPRELVVHDKAGERILEMSLGEVARMFPADHRLVVYKNNSDGKGNSYGTHENYLVSRATPFDRIARDLIPFFVSRQVFTGAGKLGFEGGRGERSHGSMYQITQRADFFEADIGLETTLRRPIINTRDEPHADPTKYRRLHCIVGDANMSEISTFLKVGTAALVLKMIEDAFLPDYSLEDPVRALHEISRDTTCRIGIRLADGRKLGAVALQWEYLGRAKEWVEVNEPDTGHDELLRRWEETLSALEADPMSLHRQLDWVAKYRVLEGYREREGLSWNASKLKMIDLQYHDVRRASGIYHRLAERGEIERLVSEEEIDRAIVGPPEDTRAYFRGRCIGRWPGSVAAASWDSLILDTGAASLQRIPMPEPLRGTRHHVGELLENAPDPASMVSLLEG